ncbi:hypothetical protein RI129_000904 [Pyrocoelia pectoralis]|uniref:Uncharacterized protein n=1 Tax=Pyrocoelia pectoralis TaxID=417401 RepID=A0AAN7VLF4_9COLE
MLRIAFLAVLIHLTWAFNKPLEPLEGPLWYLDAFQVSKHPRTTLSELIKQRLQSYKTNEQNFEQNDSEKTEDKRAFSLLARLRPFNEIGKQRTSIRQASKGPAPISSLSDLDFVSAETRAMLRPMGQPLRWG